MTFNIKKKVLITSLAALTLLTACASNKTATGITSTTSQTTSGQVVTNSTTSEYFSKTDLTATYDESTAAKITLSGKTASVSGNGLAVNGSQVTISTAGTYIISGESDGVQILVKAADQDKVQIVLNGVTMTGSDALIAVEEADKVLITSAEGSKNTIEDFPHTTDTYSAAIYSKSDLTFNGSGCLTVTSKNNNAIKGNDDVKFTGGTYNITSDVKHAVSANDALNIANVDMTLTAAEDALHSDNDEDTALGNLYIESGKFVINAGDDAIHASNNLLIANGTIDIQTSVEGIEGKTVTINGGTITINASDDGINGSDWATTAGEMQRQEGVAITINGGDLTINMAQGDTDAIDSNGDLTVTGGKLTISGQSAFDYDGTGSYTGGTLIVNGETVTDLTQTGPGGMSGGPGMPRR